MAVLRPVQVGGLSAGAVVGAAVLGGEAADEAGRAAYGMVWVGIVSVCAHGIWAVSSVREVVIGSPNVDG